MADRYFSPADVEALIPRLTAVMERVLGARREAMTVEQRMKAEQQRITMAGGAAFDRDTWVADQERRERLVERMRAGLDAITRLGGVTKDLEQGLVDFPHVREGREVNLCWKFGEKAIRYWHGLDEGYAGRKPL
ncbi:MAG: hypothetical protein AUH30_06650 [Candidatus Rokubacteria bacterium 13_1_40CM_68_15]|nr:MAG: hypothetical protein AUH30_06650 [Candidatus Rokubacteria bacterium 13_1_40CM_68_15]